MENMVGKIIRIIGFVEIAGGLIFGLIFGGSSDPYGLSFNFSVFVSWTVTGFITGVLFIGFAEVIELLQKIYYQLQGGPPIQKAVKPDSNLISATGKLSKPDINKGEPGPLADMDKEKVRALYKDRKIADIHPTPQEDYLIVRFNDSDELAIVDVGGFKAVESKDDDINQKIKQWYEN